MGVAVILVMRSGFDEQSIILLTYLGSIWNLALSGPVISEMFEEWWRRTTTDNGVFLN